MLARRDTIVKWLLTVILLTGCTSRAPQHPVGKTIYFEKTLAPLTEKELVKRKGKRVEKRATELIWTQPPEGDEIEEITKAALKAQLYPTRKNVDELERLIKESQTPLPLPPEPPSLPPVPEVTPPTLPTTDGGETGQ